MSSEELPVKLEEMLVFSFNFDNLIKVVKYLHKSNQTLSSEINDIKSQLTEIERLREDVTELQIKSRNLEQVTKEQFESLENHQKTLLRLDSQIKENEERQNQFNKALQDTNLTISNHEENLNNLNRVVEDHLKTAKENEKRLENVEMNMMQLNVQNGKHIDELNQLKKDVEDQNKEIKKTIKDCHNTVENFELEFNKKLEDFNKTITNLITTVTDINMKVNDAPRPIPAARRQSVGGGSMADTLNKIQMETFLRTSQVTIETLERKVEDLSKKAKENQQKNDKTHDDLKIKIADINVLLDRIQYDPRPQQRPPQGAPAQEEEKEEVIVPVRKSLSTKDVSNTISINQASLDNLSDGIISSVFSNDKFKKLQENLRIISNSIGNKVNKEDLESSNRQLVQKIEKIADKLNDNLKFYDNKLKNFKASDSSQGNQNFDMSVFAQNLEAQITEQIKKEAGEMIKKELPNIDLSINPGYSDTLASVEKHTEELNETYKSIVDIRSCLVSNELLDDIKELKERMAFSEEEGRRVKFRINEISKAIEGDEEDNQNPMGNGEQTVQPIGGTFREKINILTSTCTSLNEKVNNLEKKAAAMSKEVKDDVKASLKVETSKVIENFKTKLDSFTSRFDHELRNKIDLIGLSSFENKINNKLYIEMRDKLDKSELKKNNHVINRKIDSLENKISKTLVDTIIDLQMDDQPLIVKKNCKNVEKCASCNQPLPKNEMYYSSDKFRMTRYGKDKLPDIMENK